MGNKNYENKPNRGFRENVNPVDETAEPVEPVVTEETVETEESVKTTMSGIVVNCEKLNIRKSPLKDSDVKLLVVDYYYLMKYKTLVIWVLLLEVL